MGNIKLLNNEPLLKLANSHHTHYEEKLPGPFLVYPNML